MKSKRPHKSETTASITPPEASGKTARWWTHVLMILGLLLANMALYHGAFDLGFLTVDDPDYVQNNPYIESFKAARDSLSGPSPNSRRRSPLRKPAVTTWCSRNPPFTPCAPWA
jgi:hypothetical protein